MSNYIPYPFFHDDVPIDISFVFENEKPAGKHGFLKSRGRDFVFEDGTKACFWGTNFNGTACIPEHDYAEKVARRLSKIGVNIVRMHQLDAEFHIKNLFSFSKGRRSTGANIDAESIDRLDYLIYCLKKEGIYVYLDMFTYRKFRSDEGVENAHLLPNAARPYCCFNRRLIDLQKQFAEELWTHENPYTKLRYCDEPAIVLAEIVNECDLFYLKEDHEYVEPYKTEFLTRFAEWLKAQGKERDVSGINIGSRKDNDLLDFKLYLMKSYFAEMTEHLRSLGVKIPITGTNWGSTMDVYHSHDDCDFLDCHPYFYDWNWKEFEKSCMNMSITQEKDHYLGRVAFMASKDKPTYISEWDAPWPNEYRADSVIYTAAIGMFQGWSGFAIHTYSYSTRLETMNVLGREISSQMIGNSPYRHGVFSTWNDPAKFGLFYLAALLTRRGDVKRGDEMRSPLCDHRDSVPRELYDRALEEYVMVNNSESIPLYDLKEEEGKTTVKSTTGELFRDYENHYGTVDTAMTKCAFGFLGNNGKVSMNGLSVTSETDFAVIAMSSLTDKNLSESDNILLTTVGRAKNTDAKFDGEKLVELGKPPVLIEAIEAEIEFTTSHPDLKVWAISAEGYYIGLIPTEYIDGKLKFTLGKTAQSMYYLIVRD